MAHTFAANGEVKRAQAEKRKRTSQTPTEYSPTSKKTRNPDPNDYPTGYTLVSGETQQKSLMYIGVPMSALKTQFAVGASVDPFPTRP